MFFGYPNRTHKVLISSLDRCTALFRECLFGNHVFPVLLLSLRSSTRSHPDICASGVRALYVAYRLILLRRIHVQSVGLPFLGILHQTSRNPRCV